MSDEWSFGLTDEMALAVRERMGGNGEVVDLANVKAVWREYSDSMCCTGVMCVDPSTVADFGGWLLHCLLWERRNKLPETPPDAWVDAMARAITTTELESEKVSQASVEQDKPHARAAYAALRRAIGEGA